jgi:hypothetical protein
MSRFTFEEQRVMMTLWAIFRSPLFMGGDLTRLDACTLELLTNEEVLAVNQDSRGNRQLFRRGEQVAWLAEAPDGKSKYLALFNLADEGPVEMSVQPEELGLARPVNVRDLWAKRDLGASPTVQMSLPAHGARLLKVS